MTMKWGVDWLEGADELFRMEGREPIGVEGA